ALADKIAGLHFLRAAGAAQPGQPAAPAAASAAAAVATLGVVVVADVDASRLAVTRVRRGRVVRNLRDHGGVHAARGVQHEKNVRTDARDVAVVADIYLDVVRQRGAERQ